MELESVSTVDSRLAMLMDLQNRESPDKLHPDVFYYECLCERKRGNRDAAIDAVQRALAAAPDEAEYLLEYGLLLIEDKRVQEGLDVLRRAVHESGHAPAFRHELYVQNALALQTEGFVDAAVLSLRKALKFTERADTYHLMAQMHIEAGSHDAALEAIGEGLGRFPDDARLHHLSGLALMLARRPYEAARAFVRACELDGSDPDPLHSLGICFETVGDVTRALDALERCASLPLSADMRVDVDRRLVRLRKKFKEKK